MKNKILPQLCIIYLRYLIGLAFILPSIPKIKGHRFTRESGADNPINSAWHFFETLYQSGLYWNFLGWGQLIAGLLLVTQRYSKLGALVFLPIIANIFVVTISYDFHQTHIITGLMLCANILLLVWDWDTLKIIINKQPTYSTIKRVESDNLWIIIGVSFIFIMSCVKVFGDSKTSIILMILALFITGISGLILGYKKHKHIKAHQ